MTYLEPGPGDLIADRAEERNRLEELHAPPHHLVNGPSVWPSEYDDEAEYLEEEELDEIETEDDRIDAERDLLHDDRSH